METKNGNGDVLREEDSISLIKVLKLKASLTVLERGITLKNIKRTDDPVEIDRRI